MKSRNGVGPLFCSASGGCPYTSLEITALVSATSFVDPSVLVPVRAQTAIRLSSVALKSSADRKYSMPPWALS